MSRNYLVSSNLQDVHLRVFRGALLPSRHRAGSTRYHRAALLGKHEIATRPQAPFTTLKLNFPYIANSPTTAAAAAAPATPSNDAEKRKLFHASCTHIIL